MSLIFHQVSKRFLYCEGPELTPDVDLKGQVIIHKVKNNVALFPEV